MKHVFPWIPALAGLLTAACIASCTDSAPSAAPAGEKVVRVETATAATERVEVKLEAVGIVDASETAEIRPQVDGTVAAVHFAEGSSVDEGTLLVRLDDAKPLAKLDLARATLDSARARERLAGQRLHRGRQLISQDLISQEAFDQLESEYLAAAAAVREQEAAVTLAARELDDYHLRAPFAGTVGARLVDVGNYVQKGSSLVILMKTDPIEIEFKVPDQHVDRVHVGTPVRVSPRTLSAFVDGAVSFINPRVDPNTRMLDLKATVANASGMLRDGQFVKVTVLIEVRDRQVVIPEEAVMTLDGKLTVYVVVDEVARQRRVQLGVRMSSQIEVLDGISPGDVVVIGGQHRLAEGTRVSIARVERRGA